LISKNFPKKGKTHTYKAIGNMIRILIKCMTIALFKVTVLSKSVNKTGPKYARKYNMQKVI